MILDDKHRRVLFQRGGLYHIFQDMGFSGFVKPDSHAFYQYIVIERGRISQMFQGKSHGQHKGDIFFCPPGCEHSLFVFDNNIVYYVLSFSETVVETALKAVPDFPKELLCQPLLFTMKDAEHSPLLRMMSLLMTYPEAETLTCGCHICFASVALVLDAIRRLASEQPQSALVPSGPEYGMSLVLRYIDQHYDEDLTVDQLIEMSQCNKSTFFTRFRAATGITPKQYITEKRMQRAMQLMEDTDMTFARIAEKVGYNDFTTFFKNFYKMSAQSPSEYRSKIRRERSGEG